MVWFMDASLKLRRPLEERGERRAAVSPGRIMHARPARISEKILIIPLRAPLRLV
jgi:hypothetical protein